MQDTMINRIKSFLKVGIDSGDLKPASSAAEGLGYRQISCHRSIRNKTMLFIANDISETGR